MSHADDFALEGIPDKGEILLIDDSAASLSLLSSVLTEAGYRVREAPSGQLALWTLKVKVPELILLDIRMPDMDGFEVCRRLKADPLIAPIPVIFLSAQDDTADKILGLKIGAVDFIAKNFPHEEILARVETHLALSRAKQALAAERSNLENRVRERTEELSQRKRLLDRVIDSGPDWICAIDRDFKLLLVNRNMARALGYDDHESLIGRRESEVLLPESHPATSGAYRDEHDVLRGKTVHKESEAIHLLDGRTLYFETYKTPLTESDGSIYGVLCYRRDITQRLAIEREKRALERKLWQAKKMEAIGQLAGGIAHDFNNMISLILGFAEFAQKALASGKTDKLESYLSEIRSAGLSGQAIIAQLLAFSRAEAAPADLIDVGAAIADTIASLRGSLGDGIAIELQLEPNLPQAGIGRVPLQQVLTNLVFNARDALGANGHIDVACARRTLAQAHRCASCSKDFRGDFLVLSVQDDGTGIDPNIVDKIFDPFQTTKDIGKGSGLGLAMVHGIVHSAGGHVKVATAKGTGARFEVWLPA
jgi:PAS domain S-box-containing protein